MEVHGGPSHKLLRVFRSWLILCLFEFLNWYGFVDHAHDKAFDSSTIDIREIIVQF